MLRLLGLLREITKKREVHRDGVTYNYLGYIVQIDWDSELCCYVWDLFDEKGYLIDNGTAAEIYDVHDSVREAVSP